MSNAAVRCLLGKLFFFMVKLPNLFGRTIFQEVKENNLSSERKIVTFQSQIFWGKKDGHIKKKKKKTEAKKKSKI